MLVPTSGDISIYLIIGTVQKVIKSFHGEEMTFTLQVEICLIVPYSQIIKRNNQIIKINDQISQQIHPRLACLRLPLVQKCTIRKVPLFSVGAFLHHTPSPHLFWPHSAVPRCTGLVTVSTDSE